MLLIVENLLGNVHFEECFNYTSGWKIIIE